MQLNRRKLLGGISALALAGPADAQVLKGGGKMLTSGGHALMRPPIPAPASGTLLATQVTLTNPAGQPTQSSPYFSFGLPIPKGSFPANGYKLTLNDASGVTHIADLQVDQIATGWSDTTINHCVVSGYATGTTLAAGASAAFTIKAEVGTIPTTPVCTTATLAANSDLKAVCKIGTDTFTVGVNNIISLYSGAPGSHPQGTIKQWKSGPTSSEWAFGQYLKRDSDGATHRWAFLKIYVTALSASGPFVMRALLENTQCFGMNPSGTVGSFVNATTTGLDVIDQIEFFNGATFIGAMGGINDTRNGTFAPANVNLTTGEISATFAVGHNPDYAPIGFSSTGTLPGGIGAAASATFWYVAGRVAGTFIPVINRWYAARIIERSLPFLAGAPVSGTSYAVNACYVGNGGYYAVTTAGVSTGAIPTASTPGGTFADNSAGGALVWKLISPRVTSQGTGSHTVTLKAAIWRASKAAMMGADTYPHWSGAGTLPKLLVGYDFNYLTTQTKSVPPLDPTITTAPWSGPLPVYIHNNVNLPGNTSFKDLGGTGEALVDERVNLFTPTGAASIYRPTDPGFAMGIRAVALSWMDRQGLFFRDETQQQVIVCNYGPNKAGSTYPGMGASVPNTYIGSPTSPVGCAVDQVNWPGYGGDYFTTNGPGDCSHMPSPCYWPYLTSGDPLFLDVLIEQASSHFSGGGYGGQVKTAVVNGVRYSWAWDLFAQARGSGWKLKIFSGAEWLLPDSHVAKPFFGDVMDDSANIGLAYVQGTQAPIAQSVGYTPLSYAVVNGTTFQSIEPWMLTIIQMVMSWEAWKGNRPGFKAFLEQYFAHMITDLFDSDVGGSILCVDAQFTLVGTGTSSVNPPAESTVIVPVQNRFSDLGGAYVSFPPPGPQFISGLPTQGQGKYVYYTTKFNTNSYGLLTRATYTLGSAAGIAVYDKMLTRINSVVAAQYGGIPAVWIQSSLSGNQNGLMNAFAKPA